MFHRAGRSTAAAKGPDTALRRAAWRPSEASLRDVEQAYVIADDESDELAGDFRLLGAAEAAEEWRAWSDASRDGRKPAGPRAINKGAVRTDFFNHGWIPLTSNGGGDSHCLDLEPGPEGNVGQVILVVHDEPSRKLAAGSLAEWIDGLARE